MPLDTLRPGDQAGEMDVQELIRSLVNQAGARTVYGDPISADGKTVVPVAKVIYGFGGGSGRTGEDPEGGGGGFVAQPIGYIEVTAAGTRFVPIVNLQSMALALGVGVCLGLLVGKVIGR